jgi:[NiFe] hydrogenase assembly HybE family chaperone
MSIADRELVRHYQAIYREKMRGLPICNAALEVQVVGFRPLDQHQVGVLITPWFMNLVLLPGDDTWASAADGSADTVSLPSEPCEFVVSRDATIGTFLSAVLFRTVVDFPDQGTVVAVAEEVLKRLFLPTAEPATGTADARHVSRRTLLTGLRAS